MAKKFNPINELEKLLILAQTGQLEFLDFIKEFLQSDVFVPSRVKVEENVFLPLFFDKENEKMASIFTSTHLLELYRKDIAEYITLTGKELLEQIPKDYGVVINPGYRVGFDISSKGVSDLCRDFCS